MSQPITPSSPQPPPAGGAMDQFAWCPRCGAARIGGAANPFRCGACGFAFFFNTASAVAVFIEDAEGRCLFIRRARDPARGKLALAGGFTDPDETGEAAVRREIREELGLELGVLRYLGSWPNQYHAGGFIVPVLDLFFHTTALGSNHMSPDADEVSSIEWIRPGEVAPGELAFPSMRAALRAFVQRQGSGD